MKAVLYLRSSKDRSDVSIDAQRRALHDLAESRGILILGEYADAVESGKDDDRPSFQSMLRDLRAPRRAWDTVLALDTARIARRRHLALIFEEQECRKHGVRVIYKSVPETDPITEMLLKSILQAMDEWHSLTSKAKGLAGMAENVRQGWRAGGRAPRGYRLENVATGAIRDGAPVTKSRLVLSDEALLVRAYLQARARGISRAQAKADLAFDWPVTTLLHIERNALTYAGHTVWNRHAEKGGAEGKYRPREEWLIQKDTHEPLITEAEADKILEALESKSTGRRRQAKHPYMLTGMLESPSGERWHADGDGNYRLKKGPRIAASKIDQLVVKQILQDLASDKMVDAALQHYKNLAARETTADDLKNLQAQRINIEGQIEKLVDLIPQTSAPDALLRKIEKLEGELETIAALVSQQQQEAAMAKALKRLTAADVKRTIDTMIRNLDQEDPELLKSKLAGLISKVVIDQENLTATLTYAIGQQSGDKVASPRGVEPRSPP
jgi:site-specific DNA recombinase